MNSILGRLQLIKICFQNDQFKVLHQNRLSSRYKPTCGADFVSKEIKIDGKTVILQIWDTAGQERFSSLGSVFYRKTDACILVGDLSNSKTFDSLENWRDVFLEHTSPEAVETFPFVCVGNKSDLSSAISRAARTKVQSWCKSKDKIPYFETSCTEPTSWRKIWRTTFSGTYISPGGGCVVKKHSVGYVDLVLGCNR